MRRKTIPKVILVPSDDGCGGCLYEHDRDGCIEADDCFNEKYLQECIFVKAEDKEDE